MVKIILKIVILISIPILLVWPFPFPQKNYLIVDNNIQVGETRTVDILSESRQIGNNKTMVSILGLQNLFISMPIKICLSNQNKIQENGKIIDHNKLIDRETVGAMSIKYQILLGNEKQEVEIYAPINEEKCEEILEGKVKVDGVVEIKNPVPVDIKYDSDKITIKSSQDRSVLVFKIIGYSCIKWTWPIFISNLVIAIFLWSIFFTSLLQVWNYIFPKNNLRKIMK